MKLQLQSKPQHIQQNNQITKNGTGNVKGQKLKLENAKPRSGMTLKNFFSTVKSLFARIPKLFQPSAQKLPGQIDQQIASEKSSFKNKGFEDLKADVLKNVSSKELEQGHLSDKTLASANKLGEKLLGLTELSKEQNGKEKVVGKNEKAPVDFNTLNERYKETNKGDTSLVDQFVKVVVKDGKLSPERLRLAQSDLGAMIKGTLASEKNPGAVLRGNSPDTAYQVALFKSVGGEYTKNLLAPVINELATLGNVEMDPSRITVDSNRVTINEDEVVIDINNIKIDTMKIEVDPKELKKGETVESKREMLVQQKLEDELVNRKDLEVRRLKDEASYPIKLEEQIKPSAVKLGKVYDMLIENLSKSVTSMPQEMRDTCALIYASIKQSGGDDQTARNGTSAAIILRLLNPALTAPGTNAPDKGSLPTFGNGDHSRAAILLSKIFQNQANTILDFESKTEFMSPLAGKLTQHNETMQKFIKDVVQGGKVSDELKPYLPEGHPQKTNQGGTVGQNVGSKEEMLIDDQINLNLVEHFKEQERETEVENEPNIIIEEQIEPETQEDKLFGVLNQDGGGYKESSEITEKSSGITEKSSGITEKSSGITEKSSEVEEESSEVKDLHETFAKNNEEEDKLLKELVNLRIN